jgi:hypothetical protein
LEEVEKERRAAIQTGPGKSDSSVERLAANEMTKPLKTKWFFVLFYGKCNPFLHLFLVRCLSKMAR